MSAHTPGMWTYELNRPDTAYLVMDAERRIICAMSWHHSSRERYTLRAESEANASLIAAAPMLLDELRRCEAHLHAFVEAIESGGGSASQSAERLAAVRDAIAKATGAAQ